MDQIVYKIPGLDFQEIDQEEDLLFLSRQDYKFLVPLKHLENLLGFLAQDFYCKEYKGEAVFHYHNTYFDTEDYKFFNLHRQGKYSRIKIRVRDYKNGRRSRYVECKKKERGFLTNKVREQLPPAQDAHQALHSQMIQNSLQDYHLTPEDLTREIYTSYDRISLRAKNGQMRVSIDFNLQAGRPNEPEKLVMSDHMVVELKSNKYPSKIISFLKSEFGVRETKFSKYCVSLCKLEKTVKKNKWKQVLKHYH